MVYSFKDTGESYEQFLARNRKQEQSAGGFLPENKHIAKEIKMADAYDKALKDVKQRCFEELSADTPHGLKELIALQNEGVQITEYIRIGSPYTLCICEDAGVYWFDSEVDE